MLSNMRFSGNYSRSCAIVLYRWGIPLNKCMVQNRNLYVQRHMSCNLHLYIYKNILKLQKYPSAIDIKGTSFLSCVYQSIPLRRKSKAVFLAIPIIVIQLLARLQCLKLLLTFEPIAEIGLWYVSFFSRLCISLVTLFYQVPIAWMGSSTWVLHQMDIAMKQ